MCVCDRVRQHLPAHRHLSNGKKREKKKGKVKGKSREKKAVAREEAAQLQFSAHLCRDGWRNKKSVSGAEEFLPAADCTTHRPLLALPAAVIVGEKKEKIEITLLQMEQIKGVLKCPSPMRSCQSPSLSILGCPATPPAAFSPCAVQAPNSAPHKPPGPDPSPPLSQKPQAPAF